MAKNSVWFGDKNEAIKLIKTPFSTGSFFMQNFLYENV